MNSSKGVVISIARMAARASHRNAPTVPTTTWRRIRFRSSRVTSTANPTHRSKNRWGRLPVDLAASVLHQTGRHRVMALRHAVAEGADRHHGLVMGHHRPASENDAI